VCSRGEDIEDIRAVADGVLVGREKEGGGRKPGPRKGPKGNVYYVVGE